MPYRQKSFLMSRFIKFTNSFFLIFLKIYLFCVYSQMCHWYPPVTQGRVSFLLPCGFWGSNSGLRLGGKSLYPMTHLTSPLYLLPCRSKTLALSSITLKGLIINVPLQKLKCNRIIDMLILRNILNKKNQKFKKL